jgi:hypothetical protein
VRYVLECDADSLDALELDFTDALDDRRASDRRAGAEARVESCHSPRISLLFALSRSREALAVPS